MNHVPYHMCIAKTNAMIELVTLRCGASASPQHMGKAQQALPQSEARTAERASLDEQWLTGNE